MLYLHSTCFILWRDLSFMLWARDSFLSRYKEMGHCVEGWLLAQVWIFLAIWLLFCIWCHNILCLGHRACDAVFASCYANIVSFFMVNMLHKVEAWLYWSDWKSASVYITIFKLAITVHNHIIFNISWCAWLLPGVFSLSCSGIWMLVQWRSICVV